MKFYCCSKNSNEEKNVAETYDFLRLLADPNRLKIICILRTKSYCVCELVPLVKISDKLISHHLKQLKNIDLVTEKREGNFIRYSLNKKIIREYKKKLNQVIK